MRRVTTRFVVELLITKPLSARAKTILTPLTRCGWNGHDMAVLLRSFRRARIGGQSSSRSRFAGPRDIE